MHTTAGVRVPAPAPRAMVPPASDTWRSRGDRQRESWAGLGGRSATAPEDDTFPALAGRTLDPALRSDMEERFGHVFAAVRVHADVSADEAAAGYGAVAYTRGSDIYFRSGSYAPQRPDGRRLIAHELAHVVQQSSGSAATGAPTRLSEPGEASEMEADRAATAVMIDRRPDVRGRVYGGAVAQRQTAPTHTPTPTTPTGSAHPAAPVPAAPTSMSIANVSGPTPAKSSAFSWKVNFTLPTASPAGGHFIQEISVARRTTDAAGTAIPAQSMAYHYWEAWTVNPHGTQDALVANGTYDYADQYWLGSTGLNTKGTFAYTGSVRFYEAVALPAAFVANNPATIAHDLPSTATDPGLTGGTPALAHNITGSWDSTAHAAIGPFPALPAIERDTMILSHTP